MARAFLTLIIVSAILVLNGTHVQGNGKVVNLRPIIGILAQEKSEWHSGIKGDEDRDPATYRVSSHVAADYVKFVESAGARVVPVLIDQSPEYYELLGRSLNGFVFPGGAAKTYNTTGYGRSARLIYEIVLKSNAAGNPMPIWGVCLGFEMLTCIGGNGVNPRRECDTYDRSLPLIPATKETDLSTTKLFSGAGPDLLKIMHTEPVCPHYHHYCVTPENFTKMGISKNFNMISTNLDLNGMEFVSTIEHKEYPIFGTVWHPEKTMFSWSTYKNIVHSENAIKLGQFFHNKFVHYARMNSNRFQSKKVEAQHLIYNYQPTWVTKVFSTSIYDLVYLFR